MIHRFLCKQCRHVFDAEANTDSAVPVVLHCPACCGTDIMDAPTWAPIGSGLNIFESDTWEYQCQECKHTFNMPIPSSPTEGKSRKCPKCESHHLHILTLKGGMPLYCG